MSRYALITGGTKGIGRAVAQVLVRAGYDLILTYAGDKTAAEEVCRELTAGGSVEVHVLQADITSEASIGCIRDFLEEKDIDLFALIFNAGITSRKPFEAILPEEWERVFYANVHFPVFLLQAILPRIERGGNVLFTGSLMAIHPHSLSLSYGVSKAAVHALSRNLVKFLAPYDIRVNTVAPGFVDTDWQKNKPAEIRNSIESKIAQKKFCDPDELAEVYRLIIENNYFNGETITVSGGYAYK